MYIFQYKRFVVLVLVCIALLFGLVIVLNNYSAKNQAKREELEGLYVSLYEQEMIKIERNEQKREDERKEHAEKEATFSPYQRLGDSSMLTSVFYLGDRNAYGKGLKDTSNAWKTLLKDKYETFPGESHRIEGTQQIERPDGGTFAYLNRAFDAYESAFKLDLLYLCIGTQGAEERFGAEYEKIVRRAKSYNKNSDVICIIEHNQIESEVDAILKICEHYELLYVDMRPYFEGKTETLTFEDGMPNEEGHKLYAEVIYKALSKAVEERRGTKEFKTTAVFLTSEEIEKVDNRDMYQ